MNRVGRMVERIRNQDLEVMVWYGRTGAEVYVHLLDGEPWIEQPRAWVPYEATGRFMGDDDGLELYIWARLTNSHIGAQHVLR